MVRSPLRGRRRRVARRAAVAAALVVSSLATCARADDERVAFAVRRSAAAAGCPDVRALAADVRRLTTKVTLDPDAADAPARIEVEFSRAGTRYRAHIKATGAREGVRVLGHDGAGCAPLGEATAVSLAVLLDPEWRPPEPAAPPPEPAPAPPLPKKESAPPAAREAPPEARAEAVWGLRAHATAGVSLGVLRTAAPIFGVGLALDPWPEVSFSAGAAFVPSQSLALAPGHVDVSLIGGEVAACLLPLGVPRARLGACVASALTAVSASGVGYFRDGSTTRPWLAFGGHAQAQGAITGGLGWLARVGALAPTTTEGFGVDGAGVAYAPPRVAVVLAAGATMTFR